MQTEDSFAKRKKGQTKKRDKQSRKKGQQEGADRREAIKVRGIHLMLRSGSRGAAEATDQEYQ